MGTERRPSGFGIFGAHMRVARSMENFSYGGTDRKFGPQRPRSARCTSPSSIPHLAQFVNRQNAQKKGWISPPSTKFIENVIGHLALIPAEIFPARAEFALDFILVYVGILYVEILDNPVLACTHILVSVEVKFRGHDYSSSHGNSGEISSNSALSLQSAVIAGMSINARLATQSAMCTSLSIGVNGLFALSVVH